MSRRFLTAVALLLVVLACDDKTGPPPPPPQPTPTVKAITINGRARIAPGETEQYQAIAQFTDGTTQVYTSRVQWFGSSLALSVGSGGLVTTRSAGESVIMAAFGTIRGTLNVMVIPAGTFRLTGTVSESGLPVSGVAVKITSGVGTGLSSVTDGLGQYRLYGVVGSIEVQFSRLGYTTVTKTTGVGADDLMDLPEFTQTAAPPSLAGTYTLTISMADDCSVSPRGAVFPGEAKTRSYTAVITQSGPHLAVALSGANFIILNGKGNAFEGRVEPDRVSFSLRSAGAYAYYYFYYTVGSPDLAERLSTNDGLSFLGYASTQQRSGALVGELHGTALLFSTTTTAAPSVRMMCGSSHHPFSLTPQTALARHRK